MKNLKLRPFDHKNATESEWMQWHHHYKMFAKEFKPEVIVETVEDTKT